MPTLGQTIGGRGRANNLAYTTRFDKLPGSRAPSGWSPASRAAISRSSSGRFESLVAAFLREQGQHDLAEDLEPFEMTLLHFRRTFVEKLLTIHSKVRLQGRPARAGEPS